MTIEVELGRFSRPMPAASSTVLPAPVPAWLDPRDQAMRLSRNGRTGLSPFIANSDVTFVPLLDGRGGSGYSRVRRWAVTPGDVVAPEYLAESALSEYLDVLHERRLRPAFLAVADPDPYRRRAMDLTEVADEAVLDLADFTLVGKKRANLRHSNTSARRAGLTVHSFAPEHAGQIAEISQEWLRTKRGGEMGFTLSRHDDILDQVRAHVADLWVIVDEQQRVQAYCTWRHYRGGQARVIDVMRRRADAPNPAMDSLLVTALERYRDVGLVEASLASVPRDHGAFADRIYPSRSLRAFKQKFAPRWEPRWLAVPAARHRPFAMAAVGRAYSPGGLTRALRHNR